MSAPETIPSPRGAHTAALLAGVATVLAAFLAFHRFEFLGIGIRSAVGFAAGTLLAGAALGLVCARLSRFRHRLLPGVLAAAVCTLWAATPVGAGVTASIAFGVVGATALAWMLACVCRTSGATATAAAGAAVGFAACSAGLTGALGTVALVAAGTSAAAVALLALRRSAPGSLPEGTAVPLSEAAPAILGAFAWGAVAVGVLRAYVPVARSCPYALSDLGVALALGAACGAAVFGRRPGRSEAAGLGNVALLAISLVVGFSFFAYPSLVLSEPAALQSPAAILRPGTCFPLWLFAAALGTAAVALRPGAGRRHVPLAVAAAATGATGAGLLAAHGRWGFVVPVILTSVALLASVAERMRRARPGEKSFLALTGALAVAAAAWSLVADPQCAFLGLRRTLALQQAGADAPAEVRPVRVDAAEARLTRDGLEARLRLGTQAADFVDGHLVYAGAPGTMPRSAALTVALPLAYAKLADRIGVVSPAEPFMLGCARSLAGAGSVAPFGIWSPAEVAGFDVIMCGPGPLAGPGSPLLVLSREAMERLQARLAPGGVIGLWLPVGTLAPDALRAALATVRSAFPAFQVFFCDDEAVIVATADTSLDYARLRALQPALRAEGFWEPMDLVAGYAADSGDLASALSGVPPWSVARPRRMPTFARRPATRLWATSIALLAQHRLAGPQRLLDRLSFASDTQKETALRAFGDVYGEQTQHVLHRLGRLALAGPPEELMAFVTSPLVCRDLFSDDANGRDAQTAAIFVALGLPEAAAATLKKAVESEPDSSALRMRLAGVLEALNRPDEAVAQYKEVLRQQPSSPEALRRMTGLLVASRRYREAAEYLERMVTQRPDDVPAMLMLGQIYVSTPGQREKAADLAQRVLALEPDNAAAHELLVLCGRAPSATVAP